MTKTAKPKVTKQTLQGDIAALQKIISDTNQKLDEARNNERRAKQDSDRYQKNWNDCEARLTAIRTVIATSLEVTHGAAVEPSQEWFRGQMVKDESDQNEAVRLLRHIHKLSNTNPPF